MRGNKDWGAPTIGERFVEAVLVAPRPLRYREQISRQIGVKPTNLGSVVANALVVGVLETDQGEPGISLGLGGSMPHLFSVNPEFVPGILLGLNKRAAQIVEVQNAIRTQFPDIYEAVNSSIPLDPQ